LNPELISEVNMDFRNLKVWQISMDLVEEIYRITKTFPKSEIYGLADQMRRAAISIPSNIAEGNGRQHPKEYVNFLHIALGSLLELITQIELSKRLGYINEDLYKNLYGQTMMINKLLRAQIGALKR